MMTTPQAMGLSSHGAVRVRAAVELLKPITWFPPMWAFACGAVSAGVGLDARLWAAGAGIVLAGPLLCGSSQVVNDWFDRHVDAINEPHRPIPSGRMPGHAGLVLAIFWSTLSMAVAWTLGPWVFGAAAVGMALAWAYSAPPFRLKRNGWLGNAAVGLAYEGIAWITGAAVIAGGGVPEPETIVLALLYSLGAHGIMTLNDFKAIDGDRIMGIRSLPVQLGARSAARLACAVMAVPQVVVVALLVSWQQAATAGIVGALLVAQLVLMQRFVKEPVERATSFSGFGVTLYVLGMLASAFAIRGMLLQ